jgi:hypothetical protein
MKAAAYIRVSTDKEEQQSSLENQREFFESYIPRRGDEIVNIYCDSGRSATNMRNRKDLQRMRRDAKQGKFEKLYVKDISRLFRNTLDFITVTRELNSYGVRLHLVNLGEGKDIDSFTLNLMATDDGSLGHKGFVTDIVKRLLEDDNRYDLVIAVGPLVMMRAVSSMTKEYNIPTTVSMNPIMVDGTGMCGGCRVTVGGKVYYACVDGPDFDGHLVDFDEAIRRQQMYREEEKEAEHNCRILSKI